MKSNHTSPIRRPALRASLAIIALASLGAHHAFAGLIINPSFAANILSDPNADAIKGTIQQAISTYEANFSNNITVNITFQEGGGLGSSNSAFSPTDYTTLRNALLASSTTADDATAYATLPNQTNDPVTNSQTKVDVNRATQKALGLVGAQDGANDGTITLNTSLCFLGHSIVVPGKYDLYSVASHEIDEVLGIGGSGSNIGFTTARPAELDLFRYISSGMRTHFVADNTHREFFSIDGGVTNIDEFNNLNHSGGDWGDWIHHSNPEVQDWSGSPGKIVEIGNSELTALDIEGYSRINPVPEPASIFVLGMGLLPFLRRKTSK